MLVHLLTRVLRRLPWRVRVALTTRPLAYWTLTALVAAGAGWAVHDAIAAAADVRAGYGTTASVLVATRAIPAGARLDATNTARRDLPRALLPAGVLTRPADGAVARTELVAGEPVNERRVGRAGAGPVAALLPEGTRGLAVPLGEARLPLHVGDRVDLVATLTAGPGGTAQVVAARILVAFVADGVAVVAVPVAELPAAAQALADGGAVLALSADP